MTTIWERVDDALGTLDPAVPYAADSLKSESLPDLYITYFLVVSPPEQHADDSETARSYTVQVSIFSRSGLVNLPDVDTAMITAGFVKGPERQLIQDPQTGHFGLAKDYVYVEGETS